MTQPGEQTLLNLIAAIVRKVLDFTDVTLARNELQDPVLVVAEKNLIIIDTINSLPCRINYTAQTSRKNQLIDMVRKLLPWNSNDHFYLPKFRLSINVDNVSTFR
jgi:hypothetical protein